MNHELWSDLKWPSAFLLAPSPPFTLKEELIKEKTQQLYYQHTHLKNKRTEAPTESSSNLQPVGLSFDAGLVESCRLCFGKFLEKLYNLIYKCRHIGHYSANRLNHAETPNIFSNNNEMKLYISTIISLFERIHKLLNLLNWAFLYPFFLRKKPQIPLYHNKTSPLLAQIAKKQHILLDAPNQNPPPTNPRKTKKQKNITRQKNKTHTHKGVRKIKTNHTYKHRKESNQPSAPDTLPLE